MKASELLVKCLENEGVRFVFAVPGEETFDILEALASSKQITVVTTQHEQSAVFMAHVCGRLSAAPGLCLVAPGPDTVSLSASIRATVLDHVPLVVITGQVARSGGFKESQQDSDIVRQLAPVTRWNTRITQAERIPAMVRKAFRLARLEKPGATHIALPVPMATASVEARPLPGRRLTYAPALAESIEQTADLLRTCERPVVLVGNGVIRRQIAGRQAADRLASFVRKLGLPVVPTFMGKGALDYRDPLAQPAVGLCSQGCSSSALAQADVVLAIGYDLAELAPRFWNRTGDKTIIHIDNTVAEVDNHYLPAVEVVGEIGESLRALEGLCNFRSRRWLAGVHRRDALDLLAVQQTEAIFPLQPPQVVAALRSALDETAMLITEVGMHQSWLAALFPSTGAKSVIIANGLASLGLAVPGALAAKLMHPECQVVAVTSNSGFLRHSQELATARRHGIAFVTVVWTEQYYGVPGREPRRLLDRTFAPAGTNLDLVKYAEAFGLPAWRVERSDHLLPTLKRALAYDSPSLVEVPVDAAHQEAGHIPLNVVSPQRPVVAA